jgi:hypothetical protein
VKELPVMAAMFEIVELENGVIALRKVDSEGEPLVRIQFSHDAVQHFPQEHLEIAKAMIEAGVLKVGELSGVEVESNRDFSQSAQATRTVH